ncbi:MAG: hypothetical protein H0S85_08520 [Desulfovibrionaceae bacterium]|jgi:hypothetical protein|nr:hypothetical protein [Desulfovibrionaceae bacterium]
MAQAPVPPDRPDPDWPDALLAHREDDAAFGASYEATPARARAWIKKTVALAEILHAPVRHGSSRCARHTPLVRLVGEERPVARVLALLDADCGPVRAAAALAPALLAGVPRVAAALDADTGTWPDGLLAALEITGVETAAALNGAQLAACVRSMAETGDGRDAPGVILDLRTTVRPNLRPNLCPDLSPEQGRGPAFGAHAPRLAWWRPALGPGLDVLLSPDIPATPDALDAELLALLHGASNVRTHPPDADLENLLAAVHGALLLGDARAEALCVRPRGSLPGLLLTPSTAGCWAWPGLRPEIFRPARLACLAVDLL